MRRSAWLACMACALFAVPAIASADEMDLALSRLRLSRDRGGCETPGESTFCPDKARFERLMSELAATMAPPVIGPARTLGPRSLQIAFGFSITEIEGGETHWRRGTEGDRAPLPDATGHALGVNDSPQAVLVWNHVQVRKGLPFGFEAAALLGQAMNSSLWSLGAALKWSLFEGFRTGLGQLPDIAFQAAVNRSVGSSQASVHVYSLDLTLSKPFVVSHTWSLSPLLGFQVLRTEAESGVVDLTPGGPSAPGVPPAEDAYGSCRPLPGHRATPDAPAQVVCAEGGDASDFDHDVVFEPVRHFRSRMFLGGQARYQMFTFGASLVFDLSVPDLESRNARATGDPEIARQLGFMVSAGAIL